MSQCADLKAMPVTGVARPDADELSDRLRHEIAGLVALAHHLTGCGQATAEDIAQEALVRAFRGYHRFRGEASLRTWLHRILVREAARWRRREAIRRRWRDLWSLSLGGGPGRPREAQAASRWGQRPQHVKERIGQAMARLSASQREVFALVHLQGYTVEEAARVLGKAPGTVKSHLHRALKLLRDDLGEVMEEVRHGG